MLYFYQLIIHSVDYTIILNIPNMYSVKHNGIGMTAPATFQTQMVKNRLSQHVSPQKVPRLLRIVVNQNSAYNTIQHKFITNIFFVSSTCIEASSFVQ